VRQCDDAAIGKQWERRPKGIHSNPRATWDAAQGEKGGKKQYSNLIKKKLNKEMFVTCKLYNYDNEGIHKCSLKT